MKAFKILVAFIFCMAFFSANAQLNIKGKLKDQTNNRANNKVDQGIDQGLNKVEDGVKNLFKKKKKPAEGEQTQEQTQGNTTEENKPEVQEVKPVADTKPTLASYSKFDFIPGEKVIFYDDFTEATVGDFPASWNTNASGEVVTTNLYPGNWFKMMGEGCIALDEGLKLPDNYTIEYDVVASPKDAGNQNL